MEKFTQKTLKNMYRYLEKYVGTYRVLAEYDRDTMDFPRTDDGKIDPSFEDLYIPCKRGVIKHTYMGDNILALCFYDKIKMGHNVAKEINDKYKKKVSITTEDFGDDCYIYFNADDIKKIATIVNPKTSGASIKPFSPKNLPKVDYKIPNSDLSKLSKITEGMSKVDKMQFLRKSNSEYLEHISNKKYDAKQCAKDSRMGTKEFIHSNNMWEDYIEFVKGKCNG